MWSPGKEQVILLSLTLQRQNITLYCPKLCISALAKIKDRRKTPAHIGACSKRVLYANSLAILPFLIATVVKSNVFAH